MLSSLLVLSLQVMKTMFIGFAKPCIQELGTTELIHTSCKMISGGAKMNLLFMSKSVTLESKLLFHFMLMICLLQVMMLMKLTNLKVACCKFSK